MRAPLAGRDARRPVDVPARVSWRLSPSGLVAASTVLPRDGEPRLEVRTSTGRRVQEIARLAGSSQLLPLDDGSVLLCHHRLGAHQIVRVTACGSVRPVVTSTAHALFLSALPNGQVLAVEVFRWPAAGLAWQSRLSTVAPEWLEHVATVDAKVLGVVALRDRLAVNVVADGTVRALRVDPASGSTEDLFSVSDRSDDRIVDYLPATGQVVVSTDACGEPRLGLGGHRLRFPGSLRAPAGVSHLAATADGEYLAVAVEAGATSGIRLVDTTTHAGWEPQLPPLVVLGRGAFHGRELIVPVSTPDRPGTLLRLDTVTGHHSFDDPAEPVAAPVGFESFPGAAGPVESLVIGDPATAGTVVLALHSGPLDAWRARFDPLLAELAAAGLAVVAPNIRGSAGYGREHWTPICRNWGGPDLDDVLAVAGHVAQKTSTQPVLLGTAYGAYLALLAAASEPHRFAGCIALAPFAGGVQTPATGGPVTELARRLGGASAPDVRERLGLRTPPILLLHGAHDDVVSPAQSALLAQALRARSGAVVHRAFATAGHDLLASPERTDVVDAITAFIRATSPVVRRAPLDASTV